MLEKGRFPYAASVLSLEYETSEISLESEMRRKGIMARFQWLKFSLKVTTNAV